MLMRLRAEGPKKINLEQANDQAQEQSGKLTLKLLFEKAYQRSIYY